MLGVMMSIGGRIGVETGQDEFMDVKKCLHRRQ